MPQYSQSFWCTALLQILCLQDGSTQQLENFVFDGVGFVALESHPQERQVMAVL